MNSAALVTDRSIVLLADFQDAQIVEESLNLFELRQNFSAGSVRRDFQLAAHLEPLHHGLKIRAGEILREGLANGGANQFAGDIFSAAQFAFVFQLEFSGHRRNRGVYIGDARDDGGIAAAHGALLGAAQHIFQRADGQALADAGAAIHALVFARLKRDFLHDFANVFAALRRVASARAWSRIPAR